MYYCRQFKNLQYGHTRPPSPWDRRFRTASQQSSILVRPKKRIRHFDNISSSSTSDAPILPFQLTAPRLPPRKEFFVRPEVAQCREEMPDVTFSPDFSTWSALGPFPDDGDPGSGGSGGGMPTPDDGRDDRK